MRWTGYYRVVIAPNYRQAQLFHRDMGFEPGSTRFILTLDQMRGYDFSTWEVWWLDRQWPCRTHEDVANMEAMKTYAKIKGAKLRRWWT